ncbi:GRAM protein [Aphelenchoides avenae]|nr:GRAM protein [Aphelenchus avenae]
MVPKNRHHLENFRRHFQSDIPGETLITSYSCSHRLHSPTPRDYQPSGRLYLTVSSLAYHSNLFGENRVVLPLSDVVGVERGQATESIRVRSSIKKKGLSIRTSEGVVHGFYGLKAREKVYAMILRLWKTSSSTASLPALRDTDFLLEASDPDLTPQQDSNAMTGALFPEEQPVASDTVSETSAASRASDFESPSCPCDDHEGRPLLEHEYQLPAEHIFRLLFTTNPWLRRFFEQCKRSGLETTEWAEDEDGAKSRTCCYRMELSHSFGPKSTMINERQVYTPFARKCGRGFVVTKEVNNSGVPYADSFSVNLKYCIIPVAERTCLLRVHGGIIFKKSILGMIRGYIERSTIAGVETYYETLRTALTDEAHRQRRRSRGSESYRPVAHDGYESDEEFDAEFEEPIGASVSAPMDTTMLRKRTMDRTTSFGDGHMRSVSTVSHRQVPPSSHIEKHTRLLESINFSLRVVVLLLFAWILLSLFASYRTAPLASETCRTVEPFPSQLVRTEQYAEDLGDLRQKLADIDEKLSTWQHRP